MGENIRYKKSVNQENYTSPPDLNHHLVQHFLPNIYLKTRRTK
nr:MAG TPA: hypothetical protein [Caudoviricetes sp.]